MILESIVTSIDAQGIVNVAPMGPTVDPQITQITLRPFRSSTTYQNLVGEGARAVVHVTDDVWLFARSAVGALNIDQMQQLVAWDDTNQVYRLSHCHRWFVVEVAQVVQDDLRATMACRILDSGIDQPFFGFNRAKHAVLEAAILATRTHLIPATEMDDQIERLKAPIEKTGGDDERQAFEFLVQSITSTTAGAE